MNVSLLEPGTVWLDTARPDAENRRSLFFTRPHALLVAREVSGVIPALEEAEAARRAGYWVAGFLAYEAAGAWLPTRPAPSGAPLLWLGLYDAPTLPPHFESRSVRLGALQPHLDGPRFADKIDAIRALIHEGDVYQVNFTFPLSGAAEGGTEDFYGLLKARQPVPYGAAIQTEEGGIVSLSPELFFRVQQRRIHTRPMKGTLPGGKTRAERAQAATRLADDAKNRAENLMIVDLLRNDLARITRPGTVEVPALFETEHHPTLVQMTSTVAGELRERASLPALFHALFPCGSVTGAPKHRAMQRIAELEERPRGVYCGAIGYASPEDEMVFSVPIRTAEIAGGRLHMGVGSGVVWDSKADEEYRECLLKARFLTSLASS